MSEETFVSIYKWLDKIKIEDESQEKALLKCLETKTEQGNFLLKKGKSEEFTVIYVGSSIPLLVSSKTAAKEFCRQLRNGR